MKIRSRLILNAALIVFASVCVLGTVLLLATTSALERKNRQNLELLSKSYAQKFDAELHSYVRSVNEFASSMVTAVWPGDVLREEKRLYPEFDKLFYIDDRGKALYTQPFIREFADFNFAAKPYFTQTLAESRSAVFEELTDFGPPSIVITAPVILPFLSTGTTAANHMVCVTIPFSYLFRDIQRLRVGERGWFFVVDRDGVLLQYGDAEPALDKRFSDLSPEQGVQDVARVLDGRQAGSGSFHMNGTRYIFSFYPVTQTGWTVGIMENAGDFSAEIMSFVALLAGLALIGMALSVGAALYSTNRAVRPLQDTLASLRAVAEGRKGFAEVLTGNTGDETGQISSYFNRIVGDLRLVLQNLRIEVSRSQQEKTSAEQAFYESEARFRAIFDEVFQHIWLLTPDGAIVDANQSFLTFAGIAYDEIRGHFLWTGPWWAKDRTGSSEAVRRGVQEAAKGRFFREEVKARGKTGAQVTLDLSITPVLDSQGRVIFLIPEGRDISEKKRIEAELDTYRKRLEDLVELRTRELRLAEEELIRKERLAALGQLTAIVSHELRNPLATIRTSIFYVKENMQDRAEKMVRALSRVERNVVRCDQIIEELLDFSRNLTPHFEKVEIDQCLSETIAGYGFPEQISVRTRLEAGIVCEIDREHLRRLCINLFENACQAMLGDTRGVKQGESTAEPGAGILEIKSRRLDDSVELRIIDNGPGIPEEIRERVFEPLFSTKTFGVGLGLPIVKRIVEQHKGGLRIESEQGKGTQVVIVLPLVQPIATIQRTGEWKP